VYTAEEPMRECHFIRAGTSTEHPITAHHLYAFLTSWEGSRWGGFTYKQINNVPVGRGTPPPIFCTLAQCSTCCLFLSKTITMIYQRQRSVSPTHCLFSSGCGRVSIYTDASSCEVETGQDTKTGNGYGIQTFGADTSL